MEQISPASVICFIDVDAFECQLYQRDEPQYRHVPCVVANSSGRILAATYEAKALGVSRKETPRVQQALKVCPSLHVFWKKDVWGKQDSAKTRHASYELVDCVNRFFKNSNDVIVELASSDELFIDVSAEVTKRMKQRKEMEIKGQRPPRKYIPIPERVVWEKTTTKFGPFDYKLPNPHDPFFYRGKQYLYQRELTMERLMFGALLLNQLLEFIETEIDLEAAGGVGSNKLLAKVGCELHKPRMITVCPHYAVWNDYMNIYPKNSVASKIGIKDIPGLKGDNGEKLTTIFGIQTMMEIQSVPYAKLEETFGSEWANKIINFSKGEDNQPVLGKQMAESIRCKKPDSRKIQNFKSLENSVKDLCEEMTVRLHEERDRHKRTVSSIRVDFATAYKSDGEDFNISSSNELQNLPKTVLNFITAKLNVKGKGFDLTRLEFFVKNFKSIGQSEENKKPAANDDVLTLNEALGQLMIKSNKVNPPAGPSNILKVHPNRSTGVRISFLGQVGAFRTTMQGTFSANPKDLILPKLLQANQLQSLKNYRLPDLEEIGKHENSTQLPHVVITDHTQYYEIKHKCFIKWLQTEKYENYLQGNARNIDFVSFHGRIADTLQSPLGGKKWEIYGINIAGVIYLWDEKLIRPQPPVNQGSFDGFAFEKLVTENSPNGQVVEEMDKLYFVDKLQFGSHRLLLVTQVDAQTPDTSERAQVALHSKEYHKPEILIQRNYHLYAQCLLTGCSKAVVGRRRGTTLHDIQTFSSLDEFVEKNNLGNVQDGIEFQNRLLSWIKSHLPESNENVVKKFSWISREREVKCFNVKRSEIPDLVVPRLYSSYFEHIKKASDTSKP